MPEEFGEMVEIIVLPADENADLQEDIKFLNGTMKTIKKKGIFVFDSLKHK